ncbi:MAG TPA: hypothetical protein VFO65_06020, partial [Acidimicrobiales bacterium]|nr:hypothetical protein [Acidimicrobiales bacterium]
MAAASGMAVLGVVAVFTVTRTIYRAMSPIGILGGSSFDGLWLASLIILWPLAPAAAALISRRRHRLRWASWSVLPALAALPLGGYAS